MAIVYGTAIVYGDCLAIMQEMPLGSVDLMYLDPPFSANSDYNAIYKDETGRPLPDQIEAFCDLWELNPERELSYLGRLAPFAGVAWSTEEALAATLANLRGKTVAFAPRLSDVDTRGDYRREGKLAERLVPRTASPA